MKQKFHYIVLFAIFIFVANSSFPQVPSRYHQDFTPDLIKSEEEIKLIIENTRPHIGRSNLSMPEGFGKIQALDSEISSKGTDFWLLFMRNHSGIPQLFLDITSDENTSGTVTVDGIGFSQDFTVDANTITRVNIPSNAMIATSNTVESLGVRVVSEKDVTVYGTNQIPFTTDSFLGLPVSILGTQYLAASYYSPSGVSTGSQLAIVSPYNNNVVTIIPSHATANGNPAGVPFNVTLDQGETFLVRASNVAQNDLTGSVIQSTLPVSVFSGSACTNIPWGVPYCDHIVQQIPPISSWGNTFVTRPLENRQNGDTWRFLASQDNTQLFINNENVATLNFGDFYETVLTTSSYVEASNPILTLQYANGNTWDPGFPGDPFMMVIPPFQQFLPGYTFSTPGGGFINNYFTVTVDNDGVSGMILDGALLDSEAFEPIPGTDFSAAAFPIEINSSYNITNTGGYPFGLYVYGFNQDDSYGYPGGLSLISINPGSGPAIALTESTMDLFCVSLPDDADLTISALITDVEEPFVQSATLYYRTVGEGSYSSMDMTEGDNDVWSAVIPAGELSFPGLEFYILATDGQLITTSPAIDPASNPYSLGINNEPPQIIHTPVTLSPVGQDILIEAEVTDDTDFLESVVLYYRVAGGTPIYTMLTMVNVGGDTYTATIPGAAMTGQGLEYYIKATDNHGVSCTAGSADMPFNIQVGTVTPDTFTLTLLVNPEDAGVVTGAGDYEAGEEVSVTAAANPGWEFVNWTDLDDNVVSTEPDNLIMMPAEDLTLIANFQEVEGPDTYTLTLLVNPEEAGEVTGAGEYEEAEEVLVNATANPGWEFVNWTDPDDNVISDVPENLITMPAEDLTLIANFQEAEMPDMIVNITVEGVTCFGGDDGSIFVEMIGDKPFNICLHYGCEPPDDPELLHVKSQTAYYGGLIAGYWLILVTDANGNTYEECVLVPEPDPLMVEVMVMDVSCFGGNDGSALISVSGGTPPYTLDGVEFEGNQVLVENLAAGEYFHMIDDANNCGPVEFSFEVEEPMELMASVDYEEILCFGETTDITVTAEGGTGVYSLYDVSGDEPVFVDNFDMAITLEGLGAGMYFWLVKDDNGCEFPLTFEVMQPDELMASVDYEEILCYGETTNVTVTAEGGTGMYSLYDVSGDNPVFVDNFTVSITLEGLGAGMYYWLVTDENNCEFPLTFELMQPDELIVTVDYEEYICFGTTTDVTVTAEGGTGMYGLYDVGGDDPVFVDNFATSIVVPVGVGTYSWLVVDENGCDFPISFTVLDSETIEITAVEVTNVLCFGDNTGSILVNASGGTGELMYSLDGENFQPGNLFEGLYAGTYTVYVMDEVGCMVSTEVEVSEPSELNLILNWTHVTCCDLNDGTITGIITGGVGPYSTCLLTGCDVDPLDGDFDPLKSQGFHHFMLAAGDYTVTVTDQNGCMISVCVTIEQPEPLEAEIVVEFNKDVDAMEATVHATGGTGNYSYLWSNGNTTQTVAGLASGSYSVSVTDENHCEVLAFVDIPDTDDTILTDGDKLSSGENLVINAYPNPFSDFAIIEFELRESARVTLEIYNIVGERVAVLFDGNVEAFTPKSVKFEATSFNNGIYFYRLNAGNYTSFNKLILAR